jgi:hypothetical protein
MSVIAIQIEPDGATRVFFDCSKTAADPADHARIRQAIEQASTLLQDEDEAQEALSLAA